MTDELIPAVVYGVKSSPDEKESVADQHRQALDAITREGGRWVIAEPFGEANASGFRSERGPQLEAAMRAAIDAAAEYGQAELWVFHSSRLARGDGRKGHRSVNLIVAQLLYENVTVRSVADDPFVTPMLAGIAGEQAHKYAADLSAHVKRGKRRQLERGDHLGGPVCDGYSVVREHDDAGRVVGRMFRLDADRARVVESIFKLAGEGVSDALIARRLNAQGTRTRNDRPFTRRSIQNTVTNPWYAGRVAYKRGTADERIVEGRHPSLVDPDEFDRIQRARLSRDHARPDKKAIGRPAQNHALARLAVCGRCGERLYAVTSSYRRKDGSRSRSYVCHGYKFATGTCDAKPISADLVDAAVIAGLDTLLVDFDAWRQHIEEGQSVERDRLVGEVERARHAYDAQVVRTTKVESRWTEYVASGEDEAAELVLPIVKREQQSSAQAELRLQAARDALASVPSDAPSDAMLDFANALRTAISGRLDATGTISEVNQALRELFSEFCIHEVPYAGPVTNADGSVGVTFGHATKRAILIAPFVKPSVVHAMSDKWPMLVADDAEPPPLHWLRPAPDPEPNVPDSHE
jgi:site-specific DNA recombinase